MADSDAKVPPPAEVVADWQVGDPGAIEELERYALLETVAAAHEPVRDGARFLLDELAAVDALWGTERTCLWAAGEPLYLVAGPGRGKSTLAQQLVLRFLGASPEPLLGLPVVPTAGRVLYIAADRPRQVKRSWRRMVDEQVRETLAMRLLVWPEALAFTLTTSPEKLLPWVESFNEVSMVFIDSLFNVAPKLSDEEGAANANNALQSLVRAGIEVCVIHHDRKSQGQREVTTMDDVYGGRPLTGGAGSLVYLDGEAGTLRCTLRHLKQPSNTVGPLKLRLIPRTGEVIIDERAQVDVP